MRSIWLMYHEVHAGEAPAGVPSAAARYHVSRDAFLEQLARVRDTGRKGITAGEWAASRGEDAIVLTFDDGWAGAFRHAVPLLLDSGMRATFYVTLDFVGRPGYCDPAMLRDAAGAGMEIGTHGADHHLAATTGDRSLALADLVRCREGLEQILGRRVASGSQPGGAYRAFAPGCAREAGLTNLATSRPGINTARTAPYALRRLAVRQNTTPEEVARWCTFDVRLESFQWFLREIPRALLGERYRDVRRRILGRVTP